MQHEADNRLRVLVVDDEDMLRTSLTRALNRFGCDAIGAGGAEEAMKIFQAEHDHIDVVLLDMSMPRISGPECFAMLKEVDPGARVIICTGHGEPTVADDLIEQGALQVLTKPFRIAALRELLAELGPRPRS